MLVRNRGPMMVRVNKPGESRSFELRFRKFRTRNTSDFSTCWLDMVVTYAGRDRATEVMFVQDESRVPRSCLLRSKRVLPTGLGLRIRTLLVEHLQ